MPRQHIATLDALRGIAALAVVWLHMTSQTRIGGFPFRAQLAVDFFFLLSGFIIAETYEQRLLEAMPLLTFVRVRLIRLYPLIVLGLLIGVVSKVGAFEHFSSAGPGPAPINIASALLLGLFLIPYWGMYGVDGDMFPLDIPIWSLMFEVWINIVYAAIVRRLTTPRLVAIVVAGACALVGAAYFNHGLNGGNTPATFYVGVARVWFAFFGGVLIKRLLTERRFAALPHCPAGYLVVALFASFLAGPFALGWIYDVAMVMLLFPLIVVLGTTDTIALRWRPLALFAGALSYPIYVLHYSTFTHFSHFGTLHGVTLIVALFAAFAGALFVSYVAWRFYDEPARKWLTRRATAARSGFGATN